MLYAPSSRENHAVSDYKTHLNYITASILLTINLSISKKFLKSLHKFIHKIVMLGFYISTVDMLSMFYCREGYISVIDCLLENDPHLWKTKSKNRRTPLHTAGM